MKKGGDGSGVAPPVSRTMALDSQTVSHIQRALNARAASEPVTKHLTTAHLAKPLGGASPQGAPASPAAQAPQGGGDKKS
jgi:hypothetical protein